ncbi:MAG TPA: peptidoglycan bridge formation glycyltransferase FemA/FemB family protein [Rectinemataceae bacterium]
MNPGGEFRIFDVSGAEPWGEQSRGFMQTPFWAAFKEATGWKAFVCSSRRPGSIASDVLALQRKLALGMEFLYVPFGPELVCEGFSPAEYLEAVGQAFIAAGNRAAFIRFDLPWDLAEHTWVASLPHRGRLCRGQAVQVPDTVVLDLSPSEDSLLSAMKPKWRYNIRLADKKGVQVREGKAEELDTFYRLYRETAARDGIAIHPISYYSKLFETASSRPSHDKAELMLLIAYHDGEALASIIVLVHRGRATYLYGASSSRKRALMPAYALQWEAIRQAKARGCSEYDFFGIPPDADPEHPMAGLYLFKTGFGGAAIHRAGAVDMPLKPLAYGAFRNLESARLIWHKKLKKNLVRVFRAGMGAKNRGASEGAPS